MMLPSILRCAAAALLGLGTLSTAMLPSPNGTRPTMVTGLAVTAVNSTQMRVSGRYQTIAGENIAGMLVRVHAVGTYYFTPWATTYTASDGRFSVVTNKLPVGTQVRIEVEGNGACSRPYPMFARP